MNIKFSWRSPETYTVQDRRWRWTVNDDTQYWEDRSVPDNTTATITWLNTFVRTGVSPYKVFS